MSSWVKVGAKCVCVKSLAKYGYGDETIPYVGQEVTIREVAEEHGPSLKFEEIINSPRRYAQGTLECCFHISAFRPIVSLSDDIALFTTIAKHALIDDLMCQLNGEKME